MRPPIFFIVLLGVLCGEESKLEKEIKQKLISPCCWAGTVYDLDHNPEMEEEIRNFLYQGRSEEFILDYYVSIYGERILATPKPIGFNLFAWITPIIFAVIGITLLFKYLLTQFVWYNMTGIPLLQSQSLLQLSHLISNIHPEIVIQ